VPTTSPTLMFTGPTAVASSIAPTSTTVLIPPTRIRVGRVAAAGSSRERSSPGVTSLAVTRQLVGSAVTLLDAAGGAVATVLSRSTTRGPQREAIESSDGDDRAPRARTTAPTKPGRFTNRGQRLLAAAGIGEEDVVGLASRMNSADSCG